MLFNNRSDEDVAVAREIIDQAKAETRVPGMVQSSGNASGAFDSIETILLPVVDDGHDERLGRSGIDADGNRYGPFMLDISELDDENAYLLVRGVKYDYGH